MLDWLPSRITFLRSILIDLEWLFLNSNIMFYSSYAYSSTPPVRVFTPGIWTESSGSILNFLVPVNDVGFLWNRKWLFPLLSSLLELLRLESSSPNLSIFASNAAKIILVFLFSLLIPDLLDFLDWLALELLSSFFSFLPSFLLTSVQWDVEWPSLSHLRHFLVFQWFYHRSSCPLLGHHYHCFEIMSLPQKWVGSLSLTCCTFLGSGGWPVGSWGTNCCL